MSVQVTLQFFFIKMVVSMVVIIWQGRPYGLYNYGNWNKLNKFNITFKLMKMKIFKNTTDLIKTQSLRGSKKALAQLRLQSEMTVL